MTAADESKRAENAINVSGTSGLCVHCYGLGFEFLKGFAVIVIFQVHNKATIMKVILESSTLPSLLYIPHRKPEMPLRSLIRDNVCSLFLYNA